MIVFFADIEATIDPFIKCLGEEELLIHKSRETGPAYNLNQWIISEVAGQGIRVKEEYLPDICSDKDFSPSVSFLRLLLLKNKEIFVHKNTPILDSLIHRLPYLFFGYLAQLQALTPKANCLADNSADIAYFFMRIRYLQNELSVQELLGEKERIFKVFEDIKRFDKIIESCKAQKKINKVPDNKYPNNPGRI